MYKASTVLVVNLLTAPTPGWHCKCEFLANVCKGKALRSSLWLAGVRSSDPILPVLPESSSSWKTPSCVYVSRNSALKLIKDVVPLQFLLVVHLYVHLLVETSHP